jgi:hypothetical protein
MKKISTLVGAMSIAVGLVAMAEAHDSYTPGTQNFLFQFEDCCVPTIDGFANDWFFVPPFYRIEREEFKHPWRAEEGTGPLDVTQDEFLSFSPSMVYGWNESTNRVYYFLEVVDDYHQGATRENPRHIWNDDEFETRWVPKHVAPEEYKGEGTVGQQGEAEQYQGFSLPPLGDVFFVGFPEYDWNLPNASQFLQFGWSFNGPMLGEGISTYRYEVATELVWDIQESYDASEILDLEELEIVHHSVIAVDRDGEGGPALDITFDVHGHDPRQDFVFAEIDDGVDQVKVSAVENASWGLIKAGFFK